MGFDGVIVSDYNAIRELLNHGVAADLPEAAALALQAGVDIDMMADGYRQGLPVALERGLVSMEQIDTAVRRVLRLKEQLGLFDDPYGRCRTQESAAAIAAAARAGARASARSRWCCSRTRTTCCPSSRALRSLAVIGPLGDAAAEMRGPWWAAGVAENHVSVFSGLRAALPDTIMLHARGSDASRAMIRAALPRPLALCDQADSILLVPGRGRRDERGGRQPRAPGPAGQQDALAHGGARARPGAGQTLRRGAVLGPAADGAAAGAGERCADRGVVPGLRGRSCRGGCGAGQGLPQRAHRDFLAALGRADSDILQRAAQRTARESGRPSSPASIWTHPMSRCSRSAMD